MQVQNSVINDQIIIILVTGEFYRYEGLET